MPAGLRTEPLRHVQQAHNMPVHVPAGHAPVQRVLPFPPGQDIDAAQDPREARVSFHS